MLGADLIAQEVKFDVAGGEAGGSGGVGEIQVLGFVFSACAFKFGALFAVDREIAVSDTILRVEREKRR